MGVYGGRGPMVNGVLAVMLVIVLFFLGLRLYTRRFILHGLGIDDLLVTIAAIALLLNSIFIGIASHYGLGQHYAAIGSPVLYIEAIKWELWSHATQIFSNGCAKLAVGFFLLRILRTKWHIWFVWVNIFCLSFFTLFGTITVIIRCIPVQKSWDSELPGKCWMNYYDFGLVLSTYYTVYDFAFAIIPWFVIWNMKMKHSDKMVVGCGLSLGVLAGISGIVGLVGIIRNMTLSEFASINYLYTSTSLLIWTSAETTITVMCTTIPMLRPLWLLVRYGPERNKSAVSTSEYRLHRYANKSQPPNDTVMSTLSQDGQKYGIMFPETVLEKGPYSQRHYNASHNSDEIMLQGAAVIERTDEVEVRYEQIDVGRAV